MGRSSKPPLVAICGRPNVGKSTLFNRIAGKPHAIVHSEEGITRDRAYATATHEGHVFRVVDTGGIVENPIDPVLRKMQDQVRLALDEAAVVLFVVDGRQEITRVDEELRQELFRYGKPVVLAVNKLDNHELTNLRLDFFALGFGEPYAVSATHGHGIGDLLDAVVAELPGGTDGTDGTSGEVPSEVTRVAVVGKPNTGKSSFVNAILNEERTIVDNTPGTTRDAIDIEFHWKGRDYLFIDTAGMRKKAGIKRQVEHFSISRSLRAIRRADVCLLTIDATEGVTDQDKRILGYIQQQGSSLAVVYTKWDLIEDKKARFKELPDDLDLRAPFLKFAPHITISNVTRQRLFKTFDLIDQVAAGARKRVTTAELNRLMEEIRGNPPPPARHRGKMARVLYATQAGVKPTVFVLFVNQTKLFHFSFVRFIENRIRERFGFAGVPIRIELREGDDRHE